MNLANKITMLRILIIPIFLVFIAVNNIPYNIEIAIALFIIAAITDKLDGYIARSRNEITNFGKIMDPLADKLLVTAALISLVEFGVISTWVVMIIIAREYLVTGLRTVAAGEGNVIAASNWGKLKTVIQIIAIIFGLIYVKYDNNTILETITNVSMFIAVAITVISGADYFIKSKDTIVLD